MRWTVMTQTAMPRPIMRDAAQYFSYAYNLKFYHVFSMDTIREDRVDPPKRDAYRPPLFPVFASLFFNRDAQHAIKSTILAQTLIQILAFSILTWTLIRRSGIFSSAIPIGLLWTFPHFININIYFLTESLFLSFLVLGLCIILISAEEKTEMGSSRILGSVVGGGFIGASCLIRSTLEFFPLFLLLMGLLFYKTDKKQIFAFSAACLLPVLYWKFQNYTSLGIFSDPALMNNALYHGSFPEFMYQMQPETHGFPYKYDPRQPETELGIRSTLALISGRFLDNPVLYLKWYLWGKQLYFWHWDIIGGWGDIFIYPVQRSPFLDSGFEVAVKQFHRLIHPIWVAAGLFGWGAMAVSSIKRRTVAWDVFFLLSLTVYILLLNILIATFPRYGIPFKIIPIIGIAFIGKKIATSTWFQPEGVG